MEFLLDEAGWKSEAAGVIKDISSYVISVAVAENLPCSNSQIFLNLVTKENKNFTVALNPEGFKIVGFCLDTIDTDGYDDLLQLLLLLIFYSGKLFMRLPTLCLTTSVRPTGRPLEII